MPALLALAVGLTVGGADYSEAFARAKHYATDKVARVYIDKTLLPQIEPQITRVFGDCAKKLKPKASVELTLVISYKAWAVDQILLDRDAPFAQCMADGLRTIDYPAAPPYPDLAEDLEFTMNFEAGATAARD